MRSALGVLLIGWLLAIASGLAAANAGFRINLSESAPRGVYKLSAAKPARGSFVAVCPPAWTVFEEARSRGYLLRGPCPGDYEPLIKVLAAVAGDSIRIDRDGVRVDGVLWPRSAPLAVDVTGWALPQLAPQQMTLSDGVVFVMSRDCALGFDGRYFGALPSSAVTATAVPLLVW